LALLETPVSFCILENHVKRVVSSMPDTITANFSFFHSHIPTAKHLRPSSVTTRNCLLFIRESSAARHGPRVGARGDALLNNAGCARSSSVIAANAVPAPDSIRRIHVRRNETAEDAPEISDAAVTCLTKPVTIAGGGNAETDVFTSPAPNISMESRAILDPPNHHDFSVHKPYIAFVR
jgi:hypothetical protein